MLFGRHDHLAPLIAWLLAALVTFATLGPLPAVNVP
jgi:hypothetical protein